MKKLLLTILLLTISIGYINAKSVGLVLGGGGALGFAHIGVIKALEENNIEVDVIAGSSMGAIIGSMYAEGYNSDAILNIVKVSELYKINKLLSMQSGLIHTGISSHKKLKRALDSYIPHSNFDSLEKKMVVCVVDFDKGEERYINKGNSLNDYILASASIPGVFDIRVIDSIQYVDGGVMDNLPARAIREECDYLIGVDVIPFIEFNRKQSAPNIMHKTIRLMQHNNSEEGRKLCDWLIESYALSTYHEFSFDKYMEIYEWGYRSALTYISNNPSILKLSEAE